MCKNKNILAATRALMQDYMYDNTINRLVLDCFLKLIQALIMEIKREEHEIKIQK